MARLCRHLRKVLTSANVSSRCVQTVHRHSSCDPMCEPGNDTASDFHTCTRRGRRPFVFHPAQFTHPVGTIASALHLPRGGRGNRGTSRTRSVTEPHHRRVPRDGQLPHVFHIAANPQHGRGRDNEKSPLHDNNVYAVTGGARGSGLATSRILLSRRRGAVP